MNKRPAINGFFIGLVAVGCLAWAYPELGAKGGPLKSELTTRISVFVIFFLQGLNLPSEKLLEGLLEWRLHLFVQSYNFILIPGFVLVLDFFFGGFLDPDLRLGFLLLAILPTTISTATVFSVQSGGNLTGAIINASLSNTLGVFIVPVWTAWHLSNVAGLSVPVLPLLIKIAMLLLLPFALGQLIRPYFKRRIIQHKGSIYRLNILLILYILYATFCDTVSGGVVADQGVVLVLTAFGLSLLLLGMVKALVWAGIRMMKFSRSSSRTAFFCASQKTLGAGIPMAQTIFAGMGAAAAPELGVVLLPLLGYHLFQLLLGSFLVGHLAKQMESAES